MHGHHPSHRRDIDNPSPALFAHDWKHETNQGHGAKVIRIHLVELIFLRHMLHHGTKGNPGVIDQNINTATPLFDFSNSVQPLKAIFSAENRSCFIEFH